MIESSCCCSAKNWVKLLLAAVFLPLGGVAFLPLAVNQPNLSVGQEKIKQQRKNSSAQLNSQLSEVSFVRYRAQIAIGSKKRLTSGLRFCWPSLETRPREQKPGRRAISLMGSHQRNSFIS